MFLPKPAAHLGNQFLAASLHRKGAIGAAGSDVRGPVVDRAADRLNPLLKHARGGFLDLLREFVRETVGGHRAAIDLEGNGILLRWLSMRFSTVCNSGYRLSTNDS